MGVFDSNSQQNFFSGQQDTGIPGFGTSTFGNTSYSGMPGGVTAGGGLGGLFAGAKAWTENAGTKIGGILGSEGFNTGVSAFGDLMSIYTGFKSLGLAKDQFKFQKKAWNKNYDAQAKDYENNLKDRWAARNASAAARGQSYEGMDSWVNSRKIT